MSSLWIGLATVAVSAGSAAYSANQSKKASKANKANQDAYFEATRMNEEEARKLFDGFISDYNNSKEKLEEGLSLQQYIGNTIEALDNPQLTAAYRNARNGDWEQAQNFADQATDQNVSAFTKIVDVVGGGSYANLVGRRNASIMGEDVDSLYAEAQRLRNPNIPAGSVKKDAEGNVVGGQRGDKFEFQVATSTVKEQNDRIFQKSRTAIEDDRVAAQRQQERAITFLPFLNYSEFASNNVVRPFQENQLRAQLAQLQLDAGLATNAMGAAFSSPVAPPMIDTAKYDQATAQSAQQTAALLADLYKTQKTTGTTSTTDSRANTHKYNLEGTMGSNSGVSYS